MKFLWINKRKRPMGKIQDLEGRGSVNEGRGFLIPLEPEKTSGYSEVSEPDKFYRHVGNLKLGEGQRGAKRMRVLLVGKRENRVGLLEFSRGS